MSICNKLFLGTTEAMSLIGREEVIKTTKIGCCGLSARITSLGCAILFSFGFPIAFGLNFADYYKKNEIKVIPFCLDLVALLVSVVPATVVKVMRLVLGGIIHPAIALKYPAPKDPVPNS